MIETERLKLIACDQNHFEALLEDENKITSLLDAESVEGWLTFPESVPFAYKMLQENPENRRWGMHIFIHRKDKKIVGSGGFKGAANADGMVEIGYAIAPSYQNLGLATEAAEAMIDYAFSRSFIKMVDAHTLAEINASTKVLEKCGMRKIGEKFDEEDGFIWHWRIVRNEFETADKPDRTLG